MTGLIAFLTNSMLGKAVLNFLLNNLWGLATKAAKEELARKTFEEVLKVHLKAYDDVVAWANEISKDGLTEEEKNEIRKRKIEIEKAIINGTRPIKP